MSRGTGSGIEQPRSRGLTKARQNPGMSAESGASRRRSSRTEIVPEPPPIGVGLEAVGRFLRSMRQALGLTQDELAARTNSLPWPVSRAAISALEKGKHSPAATTILALAEVLRIDTMEVMDRLKLATARKPSGVAPSYEALDVQFKDLFGAGEFRQALTLLDEAAEQVGRARIDPRERNRRLATIDIRRATTLKRLGALLAARASAERALGRATDFPELRADAYIALAECQLRLGNLQLGIDSADRGVDAASGCVAAVIARAWDQQGRALAELGRHEDARQAYVRARDKATEADDPVHRIHCEGNIGARLLVLGKKGEARKRISEAVRLARALSRPALEAIWLVALGRVELAAGRLPAADRAADAALRMAQAGEQWLTVFRATMLKHALARRRNPRDPDRHRIAYLKKLYRWVEENVSDPDVREFREELLKRPDNLRKEDA